MFGYWMMFSKGIRRSVLGSGLVLASAALANISHDNGSIKEFGEESGAKVIKKVQGVADKSDLNIRLYQFQTCPFCCKVRSFLDYFGFSYELIEVNPVTKSQLKFLPHYKKVPVVVASNAQVLIESSLIVSILTTLLYQKKYSLSDVIDLYPSVSLNDSKISYPNIYFVMMDGLKLSDEEIQNAREEREWRQWVDGVFIHLISPNVYRTLYESFETFRWFDEVGDWKNAFTAWERHLAVYVGTIIMYFIGKRLKKKHGIKDERAAIIEACDAWMSALGGRPFLGGNQPNLADLALFGSMNSFTGCQTFRDILEKSRIGEWYARMNEEVTLRKGAVLLAKRFSGL